MQDNMIDITKLSAKTKTALVRFSKAKQSFDKLMRQQYIDATGTVATEYLDAREALTSCSEPEIANLVEQIQIDPEKPGQIRPLKLAAAQDELYNLGLQIANQ